MVSAVSNESHATPSYRALGVVKDLGNPPDESAESESDGRGLGRKNFRLPWTEAGAARRRLGRFGRGWPVHTYGFRLCQLAGWKFVSFYLLKSRFHFRAL